MARWTRARARFRHGWRHPRSFNRWSTVSASKCNIFDGTVGSRRMQCRSNVGPVQADYALAARDRLQSGAHRPKTTMDSFPPTHPDLKMLVVAIAGCALLALFSGTRKPRALHAGLRRPGCRRCLPLHPGWRSKPPSRKRSDARCPAAGHAGAQAQAAGFTSAHSRRAPRRPVAGRCARIRPTGGAS